MGLALFNAALVSFGYVTLLTVQVASCCEFEDRYEVELKMDNKQQKVKLDTEFLPLDSLLRTRVKLSIKSTEKDRSLFIY